MLQQTFETAAFLKLHYLSISKSRYLPGVSQAGGGTFLQISYPHPNQGGGHIIPTQHYVPSRIFRPCDGPVTYVIIMEVGKNLGEEYKKWTYSKDLSIVEK